MSRYSKYPTYEERKRRAEEVDRIHKNAGTGKYDRYDKNGKLKESPPDRNWNIPFKYEEPPMIPRWFALMLVIAFFGLLLWVSPN